MRNTIAFSIVLWISIILTACNSGGSTTGKAPIISTTPVITLLTESGLAEAAQKCYNTLKNYNSNILVVNNNGVVSGSIDSDPDSGCLQHGFLWSSSDSQFLIIPLLTIPGFNITGARISVLSTNLVSGGITFAPGYEFATFNNYLTPSNLIIDWNYVFGVSEQGQYITGTTLVGSYLFFDTAAGQQIELTYNNIPLQLNQFPVALYSSSNSGIAVGQLIESKINTGIICQASTKVCTQVAGGADKGYNAIISSISSDGRIIYGWAYALGSQNSTQLFSINPATNYVTPLFESFYVDSQDKVVTDNGIVVVIKDGTSELYFYDPAVKGFYSIQELANKLSLPQNVSLENAYLSPNGNYLAFDVSNYKNNIFGVKIFFPSGIANYLENNLSVIIPDNTHVQAAWFKL